MRMYDIFRLPTEKRFIIMFDVASYERNWSRHHKIIHRSPTSGWFSLLTFILNRVLGS